MPRSSRIDPFVRHAITPPLFGKGKVHRARLVDLMLSHISKKLIVIAAPAGYGKTTLLADFAAHADIPVCWIQLPDHPVDLAYLVKLLRSSLNRRYRRLRGRPKDVELSGLNPEARARTFADLVEEEIDDPFVIVIDEIHVANGSKDLARFIDNLVQLVPRQVTTIVAGREPPEISLAKLMASGDLAGIGPQDLALTREELLELVQGNYPSENLAGVVDNLLQDTAGWITGVVLSRELAKASGNPPQLQARPMVYEYLASVVLSRVREDLRRFMRESSILRIMTVASCDVVLQSEDSARYLSKIAKQGLFVSESQEAPKTYEYHPLFRKFLLSELEEHDAKRIIQLRRRAARYEEREGTPEEAVGLYLDAGDVRSARRLADNLARDMAKAERVKTLEVWSDALRRLNASSIPVLRVLAISHLDRGSVDRAEKLLAEIDDLISERTPSHQRGGVEILRGLIAYRRGNYEEVKLSAERAEAVLRPRDSEYVHLGMSRRLKALAASAGGDGLRLAETFAEEAVAFLQRAGEAYSLAHGLIDLFTYQQLLGKSFDAWKTISKAHRILEALGSPLPLALCTVNLAILMHQRGRFEEALAKFEDAASLARRAGSALIEAQVMISRADLFSELQMFEQAALLFERALEIGSVIGDLEILSRGCIGTSILHRRAGNLNLALGWLTRAAEFVGSHHKLTAAVEIQGAALIVQDNPQLAITRLETVLQSGNRGSSALDLAVSKVWLGYAWNVAGDLEKAQQILGEALERARTFDNEQWIIGELNCTPHLKGFVLSSQEGSRHAERILERLDIMGTFAQQYGVASPREVEPSRLDIRGFGRGSVKHGHKSLPILKPLHRDVLFYIIDRQRADRDRLAEEFWPDQPTGRQAANLHMAVYSLRRALGKTTIVYDGRYYSVGEGLSVQYDVAKFERAASAALHLAPGDPRRYFALTEAMSSFSGRFLEHHDQPWANSRRRELDDLFLRLAELYADEAMQRGNGGTALSAVSRALEIDPLRDGLNSKYFEILGTLGRRSELVASYARYVKLLSEELGLDPPPQVRALYSRLIS